MPMRQFDKNTLAFLWEITGYGLSRHLIFLGRAYQRQLVFHLGDFIYNAIKGADVVALETNPDT